MSDWKPIETAPRDMSAPSILLAYKFFDFGIEKVGVTISYWSDAEKGWDGLATSIRNGMCAPIAWMQLPKPPTK